jgi:hypothetical protein
VVDWCQVMTSGQVPEKCKHLTISYGAWHVVFLPVVGMMTSKCLLMPCIRHVPRLSRATRRTVSCRQAVDLVCTHMCCVQEIALLASSHTKDKRQERWLRQLTPRSTTGRHTFQPPNSFLGL